MANPSLKDKLKFRRELASIDRERARQMDAAERLLDKKDPKHLSRYVKHIVLIYLVLMTGVLCMFFTEIQWIGFLILLGFILYASYRNLKH